MTEADRTTIDRDVLQAARERAETTGHTLGKVVSDKMRDSLTMPAPSSRVRHGITLLPRRKFVRKVGIEDIDALLNEPE